MTRPTGKRDVVSRVGRGSSDPQARNWALSGAMLREGSENGKEEKPMSQQIIAKRGFGLKRIGMGLVGAAVVTIPGILPLRWPPGRRGGNQWLGPATGDVPLHTRDLGDTAGERGATTTRILPLQRHARSRYVSASFGPAARRVPLHAHGV